MSNPQFKLDKNAPTVSWADPKNAESSAASQVFYFIPSFGYFLNKMIRKMVFHLIKYLLEVFLSSYFLLHWIPCTILQSEFHKVSLGFAYKATTMGA